MGRLGSSRKRCYLSWILMSKEEFVKWEGWGESLNKWFSMGKVYGVWKYILSLKRMVNFFYGVFVGGGWSRC